MRALIPMFLVCITAHTVAANTDSTPVPTVERIVLVTISSLRADRVSGTHRTRVLTPRLDGLATQGALFTGARTPSSSTVPALASLMTGRHPQAHQVLLPASVGVELPTLAGMLSAEGMVTLAALADPSLTEVPLLASGFDQMISLRRPPAAVLARRAVELLDAVGPDQRALLWVHFNDCSAPYRPPVSDFLEFSGDNTGGLRNFPLDTGDAPSTPGVLPTLARNGPLRAAAAYMDAYDATVRQVDRGIGILWDSLVESEHEASTLFVVASLHGEALGEHHYWFSHGQTLYDEELLVPILLRGPGIATRREDKRAISLLDIAPTLVSKAAFTKAGVTKVPATDGLALSSWLRGRGDVPARYHYAAQAVAPYQRAMLAEERFKLILQPPRPPRLTDIDWWPSTLHRELYDLALDAAEVLTIESSRYADANELQLWMDAYYPAIPGTPPAEDRSRHR